MRLLAVSALLLVAGAALAEDRLAPDNPTFGQYREICYVQLQMVEDCKGSALGAFAEAENTTPDKVTCDFHAYWVEAEKLKSRLVDVLPWQSVVEILVSTPGVCTVSLDLGL